MSSLWSGSGSPYRLDDLGWLQFDCLCGAVLEAEAGVGEIYWYGQSDTWRTADVQESFTLNHGKVRLLGPTTAAAIWIPDDGSGDGRFWDLTHRLQRMLRDVDTSVRNELLLLTNLDVAHVGTALRAIAFSHGRRLVVMGAAQLSASVDGHPAVRAQLPSLLGLRDLDALIDPEVGARSSLDVMSTQALARVFSPTRAYERARQVVSEHRFVVLTGPPEMGKTAIAQMLALAQLTDGWEAHECTDPDQVWGAFDLSRRQVFIADDAFGSTEYRPDAAERWAQGLGRLLEMLDDHHWLIWTSRPAPLKAGLRRVQRERHAERFPTPGQVLVDASDLDLEEKTLILFRHAKAGGTTDLGRYLLRTSGEVLVEHPHFTPERIRRLVSDGLTHLIGMTPAGALRLLTQQLAFPTEAMRTSFTALTVEHRDLLVAMLDAPAGLIDERTLTATVRRHHRGGLSRPPAELIDRLTDHFLRVTPLGIDWVHPSWRDIVIDQLRTDPAARQHFLSVCGIDGIMLALSRDGGGRGERTLPLMEADADWDRLTDRLHALLPASEPRDVARILLALETALTQLDVPRQSLEATSLARQLLDLTRSAWDESHHTIPAFLLEAWYRLRAQLSGAAQAPRLAATWAELHPGSLSPDCVWREELIRADEWLAVAQILRTYEPAALGALGFFDRDRAPIEQLIEATRRPSDLREELRPVAESLLGRIEELMPELRVSIRMAARAASYAETFSPDPWWVPADIAAPPSAERVTDRTDFTRHDVARVLDDL